MGGRRMELTRLHPNDIDCDPKALRWLANLDA
jgi:hypothetical protein